MSAAYSAADKRDCAAREATMRERVYPARVSKGAMSQATADRELAIMREIVEDYRRQIGDLFTAAEPPKARKIWVLSKCHIQEGGGDVMPAELFATEKAANDRIRHYDENPGYDWGCVDWELNEVEVPQ